MVQDLAPQRLESYPCKTKTFQETEKSLQKFLGPTAKKKVIHIDSSLVFGKDFEELFWNHCTSHRSDTNDIAERAVRRMKEGTSAVLLQSGLDEVVGWFHGMLPPSARHTRPLIGRNGNLEKYSVGP